MRTFKPFSLVVYIVFALTYLLLKTEASDLRAIHNSLEARYARAHSLGNNYHFSARDGWQTVNITNLQYKYRRDLEDEDTDIDEEIYDGSSEEDDRNHFVKRASTNTTFNPPKAKSKSKSKPQSKAEVSKNSKQGSSKSRSSKKTPKTSGSKASGITASIKSILASLKGTGKAEPVTITWYTGHDLENPSCWPNPKWAPTDASFACALTLEGWATRPKCFKFLELCNTPKKCVFVRVVDSCAGCAKGSQHVDLTKAAFTALASLDQGRLQVQMRQANEPDGWLEPLWGPKVGNHA